MALDLSKPLRRKSTGSPVVLLQEGDRDVAYAVKESSQWEVRYVNKSTAHGYLENVPERRTLDRWANVNNDGTCGMYVSRGLADEFACSDRIACVHITQEYEVGEGLS